MADVLTYVLHFEGELNKNSLGAVSEAAARAEEIGGQCHALVLGGDDLTDELCSSLGAYGATKVFRARGPEGLAPPVIDAMAKAIDEQGHGYALFGGGLLGFEIGAGLAARKQAGVTMEVTSVRAEDGKLVAERPILQDSQISVSRYRGDLGIIIGRINAFEVVSRDGGSAEVVDLDIEYSSWSTQASMVQRGEQRGADVDIEGADVLVAGGRGLGQAENFKLAEDLASAFGGNTAVAATRAVVDGGWYPDSAPEGFVERELDTEDERVEVGVVIVGGGPAGLACANRLLQLLAEEPEVMERLGEVPVAVIEKGKACGAHNLSGAMMRPSGLKELFPDLEPSDWPTYGTVEKDSVYWMLGPNRALPLKPTPPPFRNHGNYMVSVAELSRWLSTQAEEAGAYILTETSAYQLPVEG